MSVSADTSVRRVIEVDPLTDVRWEAFAVAHPDVLVYHLPVWLKVLEQSFGYRPFGLACEDHQGQLQGILPVIERRSVLVGSQLCSLPLTPVAGPLANGVGAASALVNAAIDRVITTPGRSLLLRAAWPGLDGLSDRLVGEDADTGYAVRLPDDPDSLRFRDSRHHSAIRRAVNKGARHGLTVRVAETEAELRNWYRLYLDTMRWHAVPPRPYKLFRNCWHLLRPSGHMRLLLAERAESGRNDLLAGCMFFMSGKTVLYAYNGRRREHLWLRPNDAIHWEALHDACRDGYDWYDFGGIIESQGLAQFKSKWGAEPRQLRHYYFPALPKPGMRLLAEGGPIRQLANGAWRRLPLPATALFGDCLYRLA